MGIVKGIIEVPYIEGTPARVNHKTGYIFVSKAHFDKLEPVYREFVLAHEEGHLVLNTSNEEAADQYAVNKLLKKGYPLSKIMQSLTRVLNYDKPGHYGRTLNVFSLLAHHDIVNNKNKKLLNILNQYDMVTPVENMYLDDIYTSSFVEENEFDDFLGLGKRARERREERHRMRMEKKAAKNEIRRAKAEEKRAKAKAIEEGTYQPESFGSGLAKALGGIGNAAATILGKGGSQEDSEPIEKSAKAEQKNNYTWIFILIGVILLIIVAYFIFFRKKKK
jgi:LPXTG-motif cell wall-anchored protein